MRCLGRVRTRHTVKVFYNKRTVINCNVSKRFWSLWFCINWRELACERQTFLLAHSRWRTFRETSLSGDGRGETSAVRRLEENLRKILLYRWFSVGQCWDSANTVLRHCQDSIVKTVLRRYRDSIVTILRQYGNNWAETVLRQGRNNITTISRCWECWQCWDSVETMLTLRLHSNQCSVTYYRSVAFPGSCLLFKVQWRRKRSESETRIISTLGVITILRWKLTL